jgi:hypothetical protein
MQDDNMMTSAGTQDDDVSNDAGPDVGRKFDGRRTDVRRTSDESLTDKSSTDVGWKFNGRKFDERPMIVRQTKVGWTSDV